VQVKNLTDDLETQKRSAEDLKRQVEVLYRLPLTVSRFAFSD
jgi:hypothetical protein